MKKMILFFAIALLVGKYAICAAEPSSLGRTLFTKMPQETRAKLYERVQRFGWSFNKKNSFKVNDFVLVEMNNRFVVGQIYGQHKSGRYEVLVNAAAINEDRAAADYAPEHIGKQALKEKCETKLPKVKNAQGLASSKAAEAKQSVEVAEQNGALVGVCNDEYQKIVDEAQASFSFSAGALHQLESKNPQGLNSYLKTSYNSLCTAIHMNRELQDEAACDWIRLARDNYEKARIAATQFYLK